MEFDGNRLLIANRDRVYEQAVYSKNLSLNMMRGGNNAAL